MPTKICEPKMVEVKEGQRKLHNELHNLYSSINVILVMKSRRIIQSRYVAPTGDVKNAGRVLVGGT